MWARIRLDRQGQEATARETLEILYRDSQGHKARPGFRFLDNLLHWLELFSFFEKEHPCNLLDRVDLHTHGHESELGSTLQGAFYRAKGAFDEAVSYIYRKYFTDGISPLHNWELMVDFDFAYGYMTSDLATRLLAWSVCQAIASLGSKHPKALFHLGVYAQSLYLSEDYESSLAWYQWLWAVRRQVLGDLHPATAGAMLGVARSTPSCEIALDAAMGAYDRRLVILGFDDLLTRNARLVLDETEDNCADYLSDSEQGDTLNRWKMRHLQSQDVFAEEQRWPLRQDEDSRQTARQVARKAARRNVGLARAFLENGQVGEGLAILLRVLRLSPDSWDQWWLYPRRVATEVINRYAESLVTETDHALSNLTSALEQLWHSSSPDYPGAKLTTTWDLLQASKAGFNSTEQAKAKQNNNYDTVCIHISISLSLSLLSWTSNDLRVAEYWLSKIRAMPPEWFATKSCQDQYYGPSPLYEYLYDIVSAATNWNHQHHCLDGYDASESFVHLVLLRMIYLEPTLAARLSLGGWDFALCSASLPSSVRALDYDNQTAKGARRYRLAVREMVAEGKEFAELDRSESCFTDVRRFGMCRPT